MIVKISQLSEQSYSKFCGWTCQDSLKFTAVKFTNIEMLNCKNDVNISK